jgi:hypothetical protein
LWAGRAKHLEVEEIAKEVRRDQFEPPDRRARLSITGNGLIGKILMTNWNQQHQRLPLVRLFRRAGAREERDVGVSSKRVA